MMLQQRNYRVILVALAFALVACCFGGCREGGLSNVVGTNSSETLSQTEHDSSQESAKIYEPLVDDIYWSDTSWSLCLDGANPDDYTGLQVKMDELNLAMPLDSGDRITAYAWELARILGDYETTEETGLYVYGIWHFPEDIWAIAYVPRTVVTENGELENVRMGLAYYVVSAEDGTILNKFSTV